MLEIERRDRAQIGRQAPLVRVDGLADLLQTGGRPSRPCSLAFPNADREAGIHLVACAQKPTAALIGSAMKANFRCASSAQSPAMTKLARPEESSDGGAGS